MSRPSRQAILPFESKRAKVDDWPKPLETLTRPGLNLRQWLICSPSRAQAWFEQLESDAAVQYKPSEDVMIKVMGKVYDIPRRVAMQGDDGLSYTYSSTKLTADAWTSPVLQLKEVVEKLVGCSFNLVLINRYKDGQDCMGEHQDNEPELDPSAPVVSLSFGAPRDFVLKHKHVKKKQGAHADEPVVKMQLQPGHLVAMDVPSNRDWYHGVPRRALSKVNVPRINLTFRKATSPDRY
eukprot:m.173315 g.173315  ORF g.173315 m.173315 type:complete len:237 (-) comp16731_c0_seq27:470-1180(-)